MSLLWMSFDFHASKYLKTLNKLFSLWFFPSNLPPLFPHVKMSELWKWRFISYLRLKTPITCTNYEQFRFWFGMQMLHACENYHFCWCFAPLPVCIFLLSVLYLNSTSVTMGKQWVLSCKNLTDFTVWTGNFGRVCVFRENFHFLHLNQDRDSLPQWNISAKCCESSGAVIPITIPTLPRVTPSNGFCSPFKCIVFSLSADTISQSALLLLTPLIF